MLKSTLYFDSLDCYNEHSSVIIFYPVSGVSFSYFYRYVNNGNLLDLRYERKHTFCRINYVDS